MLGSTSSDLDSVLYSLHKYSTVSTAAFEDSSHFRLLPFSFTRPVYHLRTGIFTAKERWEKALNMTLSQYAYDYLQAKFNSPLPSQPQVWIRPLD